MAQSQAPLCLVVDASSTPLHLGIPCENGWENIVSHPGQAMDGIFIALRELFNGRSDNLRSVNTIYYCSGPGSTLGLRLAAAFVKTMIWEARGKISLFEYNALDLASFSIGSKVPYIQAPFRMGKRFVRSGDPGTIGKKKILTEEDALQDFPDSLHLLGPRQISAEIPENKILKYELASIQGLKDLSQISQPADQPVPYSPEPVTFKKWEGGIPAKK